eukprot:Skav236012  [mRNA]  locus=scaffold3189:10820:16557:- [translate_table: standard]
MATDSPVVNLHVTLLDKSQSKAVAGAASLDTCVWKLGEQSGMLSLTTSPQSNFGYVFRSGAGVWRSNQHPRLTLADAGVTKTGDMVQFMGDFEPFAPAPVVPGTVVELQMMLIDKSKSSTVKGQASLEKCVWDLGQEVGLQKVSGFVFGSKQWSIQQHPKLTLADAGVRNNGETIAFVSDLAAASPASTRAPSSSAGSAPASPAVGPVPAPAMQVDLKVTIDALTKSITKMCRVSPEKCVWSFGQEVGIAMLDKAAASNGYVLSRAGHHWRSNQHPHLTLAEAGVRNGEAIVFTADFQPLASQKVGPTVDFEVTFLDKSRSWTTPGQAPLDRCVWTFGENLGMRKLTTGPLSNYGFVFRCGGQEWRSNRHPNLTLAEAGLTQDGGSVEFLGDFEPPSTAAASPLVELHVTLLNKDKTAVETSTHKTSLEKGVWRFGEEQVGVRKLMTSSLSHFGYVFKFGEQSWRKAHHPNLTLAEAGVKAGDTVQFTGDFEAI